MRPFSARLRISRPTGRSAIQGRELSALAFLPLAWPTKTTNTGIPP